MEKYLYPPDRIYNGDERLVRSAVCQGKIIAVKERKQISKISSAERGYNVIGNICFSVAGRYGTLLLFYYRKRLPSTLLNETRLLTYGVTHSSGWMHLRCSYNE